MTDYRSFSKKYHSKGNKQLSRDEVEAYVKARMPATKAAIVAVLQEISSSIPFEIQSFVDYGAGPAAGLLAAKEIFPGIEKAVLIEKNPHMIERGRSLVDAEWIVEDLIDVKKVDADLALFSYSLGELKNGKKILERAFSGAKVLVVIEPGTPDGYQAILNARKTLIELGGYMIAPCPHMRACPMEGNDWCHFSVRLERTREHKHLKGGERGWEDEKYSYVAFAKEEVSLAENRIVRHPQKGKGHVSLELCGQKGLETRVVTKKQGVLYKRARKVQWGRSWEAKEDRDISQDHIH